MERRIRIEKIYFMGEDNFSLKVGGGLADRKVKEWCHSPRSQQGTQAEPKPGMER